MNTEITSYAGLGVRAVAAIVDIVIMAVPVLAIELLVRANNPAVADQDVILVAEFMKFLFWWFYFAGFMASSLQATPGMKIFGMRLKRTSLEQAGFGRTSLRYFALFLSVLLLFIGVIMIAFNEKKRALHDYIAGTVVVFDS